jgi:hypothetical protein
LQLSRTWERQLNESESSDSEDEEEKKLPPKEHTEDYRSLNKGAGYIKVCSFQ